MRRPMPRGGVEDTTRSAHFPISPTMRRLHRHHRPGADFLGQVSQAQPPCRKLRFLLAAALTKAWAQPGFHETGSGSCRPSRRMSNKKTRAPGLLAATRRQRNRQPTLQRGRLHGRPAPSISNLADLDKSPGWQVPVLYHPGGHGLRAIAAMAEGHRHLHPDHGPPDGTQRHQQPSHAGLAFMDMAKWRKDYIAWAQKAQASNPRHSITTPPSHLPRARRGRPLI